MSWKIWLSLFCILSPLAAHSQTLRFATWNIENFWHVEGESLRGPYKGRDTIRFAHDYAAIQATIARLDAHVWALQEIGSPKAAHLLFPDTHWTLVFSRRYAPENARDIYTALAIKKGAIEILSTNQIPLNVSGSVREGTAAHLKIGPRTVWAASVHLKSACPSHIPNQSAKRACQIMAQQIPILETWIDTHLDQGILIGGDFNRRFMGDTAFVEGVDPVWLDLADEEPSRLLSFPFSPTVNCPEGRYGARTWPVDFILTNEIWARASQPGIYVYPMGGEGLSDHCPVMVEFDLSLI